MTVKAEQKTTIDPAEQRDKMDLVLTKIVALGEAATPLALHDISQMNLPREQRTPVPEPVQAEFRAAKIACYQELGIEFIET